VSATAEWALGIAAVGDDDEFQKTVAVKMLGPHRLASRDPLEIAHAVCEREVAPPRVNAELDIVLKAMQKEPARRYQSVEQFSEDIRRLDAREGSALRSQDEAC
jgi:hypothetical protein